MTLPGTLVLQQDLSTPGTAPTATDTWHVAGLADRGPTTPLMINSMGQFVANYGERQSYSVLYDALDAYFREGGARAIVSRIVGPAAAVAGVNLSDGTNPTLRVDAIGPGAYGNNLRVQVIAGATAGTFILVIFDLLVEIERSPELADQAAAVAWAANSRFVRVSALAGTGDPIVVAATALTGGTDDRAAVTDTQRIAALTRITKDLGPGQVSIPGATTSTLHLALLDHAAAMNRVALLDAPDTVTAATLLTAGAAARASSNARFGGLFAPWGRAPGVAANTTRDIPPSAVVAGTIARSDTSGMSPNVPSAGENGISRYLTSVKATFTALERDSLNEAGVNVLRVVFGSIRIYGYRTAVNPQTNQSQMFLGNSRMLMAITARADAIAERFVFDQIDGKGLKAAELAGDLTAMLDDFYATGSLFGATPDDARRVDVGPTVNTPATIAAGELRAAIYARISPHAELVVIQITKKPVTEAI